MCLSEYFEVFECIYAPVVMVLIIIELRMKLKICTIGHIQSKNIIEEQRKGWMKIHVEWQVVELHASYGMILSHILTVQMLKEFRPNSYLVWWNI